jgi:hypothetical protein
MIQLLLLAGSQPAERASKQRSLMSDDLSTESHESASDPSASLVSGSADAIKYGAYAVGDLAEAGFDVAVAGSDALFGVVNHLTAGVLDAVGAEDSAAFMRSSADTLQDAAVFMLKEAGKEVVEAKEDIVGR